MTPQTPDHFSTALNLEAGETLGGRYQLDVEIGHGGMGTVWLAQDTQLGRPVAIKVLPAALSRDKRAISRLKQEANRNLDLTHANIVRLYTFDQDPARGGVAFLVMQYVDGETLDSILASYPSGMPVARVAPWMSQIAQAVDYAHEQGVLHRDIKPSNVIIETATDTAYLMDFGIARETHDTMTRATGIQDSSGTLPYMSPQQLLGKNEKSNDIYSFAATVYEALAGQPPFYTGDIATQIREVEPEPIDGLPAAIGSGVMAGLAKEPTSRPTSCSNVLTIGEGRREPGRAADASPRPVASVADEPEQTLDLVTAELARNGIRHVADNLVSNDATYPLSGIKISMTSEWLPETLIAILLFGLPTCLMMLISLPIAGLGTVEAVIAAASVTCLIVTLVVLVRHIRRFGIGFRPLIVVRARGCRPLLIRTTRRAKRAVIDHLRSISASG